MNLTNLSRWQHCEGINGVGVGACGKHAVLLFLLQDHADVVLKVDFAAWYVAKGRATLASHLDTNPSRIYLGLKG